MNTDKEQIILLSHLSKRLGDVQAVDDLSLTVHKGDIYGFLGPNGSGKSTTIRMIASLVRPDKGDIRVFGLSLGSDRDHILSRTGFLIERPDFYLYLSAYKNLELLAKISRYSCSPEDILEVLDLTGLKQRKDSKVRTFSHGMKQRLGIAQALLHKPDLLILDEPDTGLDPQGIRDIRQLIRNLNADNDITIFVSSHKLHEIEQIANRMAIINKGKAVIEGEVRELLDTAELKIKIETEETEQAFHVLHESQLELAKMTLNDDCIYVNAKREVMPLIVKRLTENGVQIRSIFSEQSLEDYFLTKT